MPNVQLPEIISFTSATFAVIVGILAFLYTKEQDKKRDEQDLRAQTLETQLAALKNEHAHFQTLVQGKQQDSLHDVIEHASVGIVIFNETANILSINPFAETLTKKKSADCMLGDMSLIFESLGTSDSISKAAIIDAITNQKSQQLKGKMHGDGTGILVSGTLIPFTLKGVKQIMYVFHTNDTESQVALQNQIADLEHTLAAVKGEHHLTTSIVDHVPVGMCVIAPNKTIFYANPQALTLLGVTKEACLERPYKELLRLIGTDGTPKIDTIDMGFHTQTVLPQWTFLLTKHGSMPIMGAVSPLPDGNALLVFIDATDAYQNQTDERSFFSGAAHDLRTPLTAIRGFLDLSLEGIGKEPNDKIHSMISDAQASVLHLIGLVNDLLAVSRIDMGKVEVHKEPFDITIVAREIIQTSKILAQNNHITLEEAIDEVNIPKVLADPLKTKEILQNLLSNAIKYTHQGGITVTYAVVGSFVHVRVIDTGMGVTDENKRLLFKKFQQVGIARNQPLAKSTGLGLYISKTFATMMGGDIVLEKSVPGSGSTFTLKLPIAV